MTQISPMLAVSDPDAAIGFYKRAFGATVLWQLGEHDVIAGLEIDGARFYLAPQSPEYGTRAPDVSGFTTIRIELFVEDPTGVHARAIAAGATEHSPVNQHQFDTRGPEPISRMLQGAIIDPFGHMWLIGKFLH